VTNRCLKDKAENMRGDFNIPWQKCDVNVCEDTFMLGADHKEKYRGVTSFSSKKKGGWSYGLVQDIGVDYGFLCKR